MLVVSLSESRWKSVDMNPPHVRSVHSVRHSWAGAGLAALWEAHPQRESAFFEHARHRLPGLRKLCAGVWEDAGPSHEPLLAYLATVSD